MKQLTFFAEPNKPKKQRRSPKRCSACGKVMAKGQRLPGDGDYAVYSCTNEACDKHTWFAQYEGDKFIGYS